MPPSYCLDCGEPSTSIDELFCTRCGADFSLQLPGSDDESGDHAEPSVPENNPTDPTTCQSDKATIELHLEAFKNAMAGFHRDCVRVGLICSAEEIDDEVDDALDQWVSCVADPFRSLEKYNYEMEEVLKGIRHVGGAAERSKFIADHLQFLAELGAIAATWRFTYTDDGTLARIGQIDSFLARLVRMMHRALKALEFESTESRWRRILLRWQGVYGDLPPVYPEFARSDSRPESLARARRAARKYETILKNHVEGSKKADNDGT